jgi:hypothetical protein
MVPPGHDSSDLIVEAARQASQSKDNSLFSLLLRLEEQSCGAAADKKIRKSEMSIVLDPQPSLVAPSRYIE